MALADYAENALLDHVLGRITYTRPKAVYLELFTTNPDDADVGGIPVPAGAGYSGRLAIANNAVLFPPAKQGVKTSGIELPFGVPADNSWGTIVGVGLYDAQAGGNLLVHFEVVPRLLPRASVPVVLPPGDLCLKLRGSWSEAFANQVLDHLLGGHDFVPPPVWFYGLLAAGVELTDLGYERQAAQNNAVNFPPASSGKKANGRQLLFGPAGAPWATSTGFALYATPTSGSYSMAGSMTLPLPVPAATSAVFDPGDFAFSLD